MRLNPFNQKDTSKEQKDDLGFGEQLSGKGVRLLTKDGNFNVDRQGVSTRFVYQWLIEMSWIRFYSGVFGSFILANLLFGFIFLLLGSNGIDGILETDTFLQYRKVVFFSIQTFTTVGYGAMAPINFPHEVLASIVSLVGLLSVALVTGLIFARFSRPRELILFSDKALISPYQGGAAFMFRIASRSSTKLINVRAQVVYSWIEISDQGERKRNFYPMPLEREEIAMFPLNWTIVHSITQDSPLFACSALTIKESDGEFIVQISGYDETYARIIYAHVSYGGSCLEFGKRFARMYYPSEEGNMVLRLDHIDEIEEAPLPTEFSAIKPSSSEDVTQL